LRELTRFDSVWRLGALEEVVVSDQVHDQRWAFEFLADSAVADPPVGRSPRTIWSRPGTGLTAQRNCDLEVEVLEQIVIVVLARPQTEVSEGIGHAGVFGETVRFEGHREKIGHGGPGSGRGSSRLGVKQCCEGVRELPAAQPEFSESSRVLDEYGFEVFSRAEEAAIRPSAGPHPSFELGDRRRPRVRSARHWCWL
jgi:hypothetical protein